MLLYLASAIIVLIIISVYQKKRNAVCTSDKRLDGKTIIITGGTIGMGLETAIDFAKRRAKVIIACPFEEEGTTAEKVIIQKTGNTNVRYKYLDLGSLKSVREFVKDVLESEERLDILVNNAGVGVPGDFLTADGLNFIMQVNYFGHFLLTILLLPLLKKTANEGEPGRVILVSSLTHRIATVNIKHLNTTNYHWMNLMIYSKSKLCMVLFAHEMTKKLSGTNVVINCVDPSFVGTKIYCSFEYWTGKLLILIFDLFSKTPWEGAQTALYAALDDEAGRVSGQYFKNCKPIHAAATGYDNKVARELFDESIRLVKLEQSEVDKILGKSL